MESKKDIDKSLKVLFICKDKEVVLSLTNIEFMQMVSDMLKGRNGMRVCGE